jgi:hypothetical protein
MAPAIARETFGAAFTVFLLALHAATLTALLAGRGTGKHKIGWSLAILLLPAAGPFLYLVWRRRSVDRPLLE